MADALSRNVELVAVWQLHEKLHDRLCSGNDKDPIAQNLVQFVKEGKTR